MGARDRFEMRSLHETITLSLNVVHWKAPHSCYYRHFGHPFYPSSMVFDILQNEKKWKQLAELAIKNCEFQLAQECLHRAEDFGGLLLLASSAGHADMIAKLAESALEKGKNNVAFLAYYLLGR